MSLFENIERTHVDDRDLGESTYSFLNRSAQPGVARTRKLLESWFEKEHSRTYFRTPISEPP